MYEWFDLTLRFLGRLRLTRLTSYQMASHCLEAQASHLCLKAPIGGDIT